MMMKSRIRQVLRRLVRAVVPTFPAGHYYSPIVDPAEIQRDRARVFDSSRRITDVDLREASQLELLQELARHYPAVPFTRARTPNLRFYYANPMFGYSDAIVYACMLAHRRPRQVVEIGSGFTSALLLDVRDRLVNGNIECTFIEPHPRRLEQLLSGDDQKTATIYRQRVQDVPLSVFDALEAGDILFIDSSHVAKGGSDVCHEVFEILPRLAPGMAIHFHDIFYPFEYPEDWFLELNRSWNEAYILRALLAGSQNYRILFFVDFLQRFQGNEMARNLPRIHGDASGGSIWIEKFA